MPENDDSTILLQGQTERLSKRISCLEKNRWSKEEPRPWQILNEL